MIDALHHLTLVQFGFIALSTITVAGALAAVTLRNLTHAVLSLILFFFGIASLFFLLRADFIGVVQILIYVGAIAVLIVFAIVLTHQPTGAEDFKQISGAWWMGVLTSALVLGILVAAIRATPDVTKVAEKMPVGSAREIGQALMTDYVLPFEVISILLTAALIGAVVIAMEEIQKRMKENP